MNDEMQEYLGVKRILGEPMTRLAYNEYRGWELPSDEEGSDEGMLVEYLDSPNSNHKNHVNYISWSPLDVFKNAYKPVGTWVERVTIEQDMLQENIYKLALALREETVPEIHKSILHTQLKAMRKYGDILEMRLTGGTKSSIDLCFGEAIEALKNGKLVTRKGWNGKDMFVMKQIPAEIGLDIVPKMQSVQQGAKDILIERGIPLKYVNQMLIIKGDSTADSWVPSSSDCFAEDWYIVN